MDRSLRGLRLYMRITAAKTEVCDRLQYRGTCTVGIVEPASLAPPTKQLPAPCDGDDTVDYM